MQFHRQYFDFGEYVEKSLKKIFFVHTAINKIREEHRVFSSNGSENSFGDYGVCLFIASAIALTN